MPLVKAQCTNCNGALEVDSGKEAAICPFCNTPYIVEKAIKQFITYNNTTVINNGVSSDQMQQNAIKLLKLGDIAKANSVFSELVKLNPTDWKNWFGEGIKNTTFCDQNDLDRAINLAPSDVKPKLIAFQDIQSKRSEFNEAGPIDLTALNKARERYDGYKKHTIVSAIIALVSFIFLCLCAATSSSSLLIWVAVIALPIALKETWWGIKWGKPELECVKAFQDQNDRREKANKIYHDFVESCNELYNDILALM